MVSQILLKRIGKELNDLDKQPRPGITCYPVEDNITQLEAFIEGPPESPYEQGLFKLSVQIPDRYPFEPPQIKFLTRIYHPNIDDGGRICADILKTGDKGSWNPAINIGTALMSLRQLIAVPNPDDPLEVDIAQEFKLQYPTFEQKAKEFTKKYATGEDISNIEESTPPTLTSSSSLPASEELVLEDVEEKPKKFLSLSKKKPFPSNSQSLVPQSVKEVEDTKPLQSKLNKLKSLSSLPKEVVHPVITMKKDKIKVKESKKEEIHISLLEEDEVASEVIIETKKTNSVLKKKNRVKEAHKKTILDAVDNTKNTGVKRKAKELDEDTAKEKTDLNKCQNTKYPSNESKATSISNSLIDGSGTSRNPELPKMETYISSSSRTMEEVNKGDTIVIDENTASSKSNVNDIASNAINIITSSMATYGEENNSTSAGNIIELSDDEDDQVSQRPMYHSFSLSKNPLRSKISLSRKKR